MFSLCIKTDAFLGCVPLLLLVVFPTDLHTQEKKMIEFWLVVFLLYNCNKKIDFLFV